MVQPTIPEAELLGPGCVNSILRQLIVTARLYSGNSVLLSWEEGVLSISSLHVRIPQFVWLSLEVVEGCFLSEAPHRWLDHGIVLKNRDSLMHWNPDGN